MTTARRPLRILFLPLLFHPEPWNGLMEHLRLLAGGLPADRYVASVAVRATDGAQTARLAERAGIEAVFLEGRPTVRLLARTIRAFDLVHVHTPVTAGVPRALVASRLARRIPMVTYHQVQPHALPLRSRLINRAVHRLAASTIAVSAGVADTLVSNAGLERRRITVIHNGVEAFEMPPSPAANASPADGRCTLAYFGRLAEEKDVASLIRATAILVEAGRRVRTLVVGDGYERPALESLARELGVAGHVEFLGHREDARALMRSVDILVHTPRFEGFGLTLIEAMDAGLPIVATQVRGGIAELVHEGENGLLVPASSPQAIAAAVERLIHDPALRGRLGQRGAEIFHERFRSDVMVSHVLAVYERVLG